MTPAALAGLETQKPQTDNGLGYGTYTEEVLIDDVAQGSTYQTPREVPLSVRLASAVVDKDSDLTNDELSTIVDAFHIYSNDKSAQIIASFGLKEAMNRLIDYPETRAEMLSRALSGNMIDNWRPINDQERELLRGWVNELTPFAPTLEDTHAASNYLLKMQIFGPGEWEIYQANEQLATQINLEMQDSLGQLAMRSDSVFVEDQPVIVFWPKAQAPDYPDLQMAA